MAKQQKPKAVTTTTNNDNVKPLDGRVGGALDPQGAKAKQEADAAKEAELTRVQMLQQQERGKLLEACKTAINEIKNLNDEAKEINADKGLIAARLQALGISRQAWNSAKQFIKIPSDEMDGYWEAVSVLAEAAGKPIKPEQLDLWKGKAKDAAA